MKTELINLNQGNIDSPLVKKLINIIDKHGDVYYVRIRDKSILKRPWTAKNYILIIMEKEPEENVSNEFVEAHLGKVFPKSKYDIYVESIYWYYRLQRLKQEEPF